MPTHEDVLSVINEFHQRIGMLEAQLDCENKDRVEVPSWNLMLKIGETLCTNAWGRESENLEFKLLMYNKDTGMCIVDMGGGKQRVIRTGPRVMFYQSKKSRRGF
jgi:hypothetical protein